MNNDTLNCPLQCLVEGNKLFRNATFIFCFTKNIEGSDLIFLGYLHTVNSCNKRLRRERPLFPMDLKIRTMFAFVETHPPQNLNIRDKKSVGLETPSRQVRDTFVTKGYFQPSWKWHVLEPTDFQIRTPIMLWPTHPPKSEHCSDFLIRRK